MALDEVGGTRHPAIGDDHGVPVGDGGMDADFPEGVADGTGQTRRMRSGPTAAVMASLIGLGAQRYGETSKVAPMARARDRSSGATKVQ